LSDRETNPHKNPFSFSVALREGYDDNINTSRTNEVTSFTTNVSPTVLFNWPTDNGALSARYIFNATYFENRPGDKLDLSHQFLAHYSHDFSERFSIDTHEQFLYYTEPSLFQGTGTLYRSGAYIDNAITASFSAQWTPLLGTVTSYSNNLLYYQDSTVAEQQDNMENTGSHDFSFAILPKINYIVGGTIDNITYDGVPRGYTSYSISTGFTWQALPTLTCGARAGGSITDSEGIGTSVAPYANVNLNWSLGARSHFDFNYSHSIQPTDVVDATGQMGDRVSTNFTYDLSRTIGLHVQGIYTYSEYNSDYITPGTLTNFSENTMALSLGATYHLNNHFDLNLGYTFSDVSSQLSFRDYSRNQVNIGVRGTY
jgi:hypothetical protein